MQSDTDKSGLGRLTLVQSVGRHLSPQPFSLISPSSWQSPPEVKFCSRWWEVQSFRVKHTYVVLWMGFFLIFQMKIIVYSEEYVKQWAYFLHKSAQCFELTTLFPQIHQLLNWYKKKKKRWLSLLDLLTCRRMGPVLSSRSWVLRRCLSPGPQRRVTRGQ